MRVSASIALLAALSACSALEGSGDGAIGDEVSGALFVANKRDHSLSRIDLASGNESARVDTCANPHELTISPDHSKVLVACYSGRSVEVYRTADLAPAYAIQLLENARVHSVNWHSDGRLFAGAEGRGSLLVLGAEHSAETNILEIGGGGQGPHMLAVNTDGTFAWGTVISDGAVIRYDVSNGEIARTRVLGHEPEAVALSPDEESLWVGSNADNLVYRLDPMTLETKAVIAVGRVPIRLAINPAGTFVVTSNFGGGDLSVVNTATNTLARTISVSGSAAAEQVTLLFSPDGERLYVAETGQDEIAEVDFASGDVLRRLPTGEGGDGMAIMD